MSASPQALDLPYRWVDLDGSVRVEVRENDDPAALGCPEIARGFPYCRATVEPPREGYADFLGWVQLVTFIDPDEGFVIDHFMPLGPKPQPFDFYGWSPTFFDAPHSDEDWDFRAHTFLCGLGGELHDLRHEVRAVIGFSWGFLKRGAECEFRSLDALAATDWDNHRDYLARTFPAWNFAPGFHEHPLHP